MISYTGIALYIFKLKIVSLKSQPIFFFWLYSVVQIWRFVNFSDY